MSQPEWQQRRDEADELIGHTEVSAATAWWTIGAIGGAMVLVLVAQLLRGEVAEPFEAAATGAVAAVGQLRVDPRAGNASLIDVTGRLEDRLEEGNPLLDEIVPTLRLIGWTRLGLGSHDVVPAPGGWLFWRPDLEAVLVPDPLGAPALARARRFGRVEVDPRPAILVWRDALAARGIELVVAPTPLKSELEAGRLAEGVGNRRVAGWTSLTSALDAAGVAWIDLAAELEAGSSPAGSWFLRRDTHWHPAAVEIAARAIASRVATVEPSLVGTAGKVESTLREVAGDGDLLRLLKLPASAGIDPEIVEVQGLRDSEAVVGRGGAVLLLGDSFTGVFSRPELGWGRGAGLGEQLARELGAKVDVITVNAGGARGSRERLLAELAADPTRLDDVRLVVWQFANREIVSGSWPLLPWPAPASPRG
jgi:alginate O-acetyltransferase complex protein AlgJ